MGCATSAPYVIANSSAFWASSQQHGDRWGNQQRTIFSIRPFHRSLPVALYCLLGVAFAGS